MLRQIGKDVASDLAPFDFGAGLFQLTIRTSIGRSATGEPLSKLLIRFGGERSKEDFIVQGPTRADPEIIDTVYINR